MTCDTLIKNAKIYDGSGSAPFVGSVAISGNTIVYVGGEKPIDSKTIIDAGGRALTPGFIDTHASTGFGYFFPHAADHKLFQGITTEIFGNCGTSPGPIGMELVATMERLSEEIGFPFEWNSLGEYFEILEKIGVQFNVASLTGHSTLRAGSLPDWNKVTRDQMQEMLASMLLSMEDGSIGLSTGLIYPPGCFADTDEIVELAKIAKERGGVYASHMRDERDKLEEAIEETLAIGARAGINVLVSHLKAAEKQNWGKIEKVLARLEEFNEEADVQAKIDVYPYTAVSTKLRAFIPKHFLEGGIESLHQRLSDLGAINEIDEFIIQRDYDLSNMLIISDKYANWVGKNVSQIAVENQKSEGSVIAEILSEDSEMWIVYHCISENDMDKALLWPNAMVCTDSWSYPINAPVRIGQPHPRSYGAFTEFIERYVVNQKTLSFQEAVRKMTELPASFFNIEKRGSIKEGYYADLVLFDIDNIKANATYVTPCELSSGVDCLWVNGGIVIENRAINDSKFGAVLRNGKSE